MSRRTAWIVLVAAFVGATAWWGVVYGLTPDHYTRGLHILRAVAIVIGISALAWVIATRAGLRRRPERQDLRRLAIGAASYLIPTAIAIALVLGLGLAHVSAAQPALTVLGHGLLLACLVLMLEAVPEELIFRGLIQGALTTLVGRWLAVAGQAVLFVVWAWSFGAAQSLDRVALFAVFSVVQGLIRMWGGSVFSSIGFHLVFQLTAQWLLGGSWDTWHVSDPDLWLLAATFVPAAILSPLFVRLTSRSREGAPDQLAHR